MTSSPSGSVTLDAAGNTLAINGLAFEFNQAGRLAAARSGGNLLGQYAYSLDGHRAQKTVQGTTTRFHYGSGDNLLAETDAAGSTLREYVWDDEGRPLAQISAGVITYLHPDHLGSPRIGTDASKNVVWQWRRSPRARGSVSIRVGLPCGAPVASIFRQARASYKVSASNTAESSSAPTAMAIQRPGRLKSHFPVSSLNLIGRLCLGVCEANQTI